MQWCNISSCLTRYWLFAVKKPAEVEQQVGDDGGHGVGEGVDEGAEPEDGAVSPHRHHHRRLSASTGLGVITGGLESGDHAGPRVAPDELTVNHSAKHLSRLNPDLDLAVMETLHHCLDDPHPQLVPIHLLLVLLLPDAEQHQVVEH